jgi:hypothetical protein
MVTKTGEPDSGQILDKRLSQGDFSCPIRRPLQAPGCTL